MLLKIIIIVTMIVCLKKSQDIIEGRTKSSVVWEAVAIILYATYCVATFCTSGWILVGIIKMLAVFTIYTYIRYEQWGFILLLTIIASIITFCIYVSGMEATTEATEASFTVLKVEEGTEVMGHRSMPIYQYYTTDGEKIIQGYVYAKDADITLIGEEEEEYIKEMCTREVYKNNDHPEIIWRGHWERKYELYLHELP